MLFFLLAFVCPIFCAYTPTFAVEYAHRWYNSANHSCHSAYTACTPWSYWGGESCGYPSHGGDCANFVSQCLIQAGHPYLNGGWPCRGYPCGKEEVGASNLGKCLQEKHGWKSVCGYKHTPPADVKVGDVLIIYSGACGSEEAHATIVTEVSGGAVKISCHSPDSLNVPYDHFVNDKPFNNWLSFP